MIEVTKHQEHTRTFLCCCKKCRERLGPHPKLYDYENNQPTFFKGEDPTEAQCRVKTIELEAREYTDNDGHVAFVYVPCGSSVPSELDHIWVDAMELKYWREAVGE